VNHDVGEQQRPLGELFADLVHQTGTLVRKEVELAKTEMTAKASSAAKDVAMVAVGGGVALLGAISLLAAVILGFGTLIPMWLSALLVGGVLAGVGAALALGGMKKLQHIDPVPRMTVETLQEDKRWLKEQVSR